MAIISETSQWEATIYQLEESDPVRGGDPASGGVSNKAAQQLANRTLWLRNNMMSVLTIVDYSFVMGFARTIPDAGTETLYVLDGDYGQVILPDPANARTHGVIHFRTKEAIQIIKITGTGLTFYLAALESLAVYNDGTNWHILTSNTRIAQVGEVTYGYKVLPGTVEAAGQLLNRTNYPRLWDYAGSLGGLVDDATWWGHPLSSKGYFSKGNGTTTFRVPDLRAMFIRGLDNGRGEDLYRLSSLPGSFEYDAIKAHDHDIYNKSRLHAQTGQTTTLSAENPEDTSAHNGPTKKTGATGSNETRPMNVGLLTLIKI